ncbi:hypothetical protein MRX96_014833 [Rhipicephalus microplus]
MTQRITGRHPNPPAVNAQAPNSQAPYAEAPYGETPYAQTPYAQAAYAEVPYGQTPYAPYAQDPYAQAPYGQTPYAQDPNAPYGQAPYAYGEGGRTAAESAVRASRRGELDFTPSLFISIGHYRFGDESGVCFIVPQTRPADDIPSQKILHDYSFNVSAPMYQLRWLYSNGTDTKGLVSVTLKGRWAHPASPKNVSFCGACWSEAIPFGRYTEVCPFGDGPPVAPLNYSVDHYAMITYVAKIDRTFSYDDERAFAEKMRVPFGIAVYDVDYDDYYNKCSSLNLYGAHSHLKALRKVVNYFKSPAVPYSEVACRTFVLS